jgi:hypothetical protein
MSPQVEEVVVDADLFDLEHFAPYSDERSSVGVRGGWYTSPIVVRFDPAPVVLGGLLCRSVSMAIHQQRGNWKESCTQGVCA